MATIRGDRGQSPGDRQRAIMSVTPAQLQSFHLRYAPERMRSSRPPVMWITAKAGCALVREHFRSPGGPGRRPVHRAKVPAQVNNGPG